ncbi:beta-hydroxyacyl-ACP dehydratase [bacterium AH-315-J04]|nr:beta-hydroxyacyl-ACP dehydratase [bacterium AH-315-J04]
MNAVFTPTSIPHREPFLFVDDIVEISDARIVTRKLADPEADFFRGHYPGNPIMPAVLLCECCFQAGALLMTHRLGGPDKIDGIPVVTRIKDARFKRMVRPGDVLTIEAVLDDELDNAYYMTGRVSVLDKPIVRVTFACMLTPKEASSS